MAVRILSWLMMVYFWRICHSQNYINLTTSSVTAMEGRPFTLSCTSFHGFFMIGRFGWRIVLRTGKVLKSKQPRPNQCVIPNFNVTCDIQDNVMNVTIPAVDFQTYHGSEWTCRALRFITPYPDTFKMDVNVPMTTVTLNSTGPLTEGDSISFLCETNPTKPPSNITWMMGNETVTRGVTSHTRNESELSVTVGMLTMNAEWKETQKVIQCIGQYDDTHITSSGVKLMINVPLVDVNIFLNETTDGDFTLTCKTNPTYPPSRIVWMKGSHALQRESTTGSQDQNGRTQAVSVISVSCEENLNGIYCVGLYMDLNRTSPELAVFIQCEDPTVYLGAGVGIGVAVTVVLMSLVVFCMCLCRRRGLVCFSTGTKKNSVEIKQSQKTTSMDSEDVENVAPDPEENRSNFYEGLAETTRQKEVGENYEAIRLYENTGVLSR